MLGETANIRCTNIPYFQSAKCETPISRIFRSLATRKRQQKKRASPSLKMPCKSHRIRHHELRGADWQRGEFFSAAGTHFAQISLPLQPNLECLVELVLRKENVKQQTKRKALLRDSFHLTSHRDGGCRRRPCLGHNPRPFCRYVRHAVAAHHQLASLAHHRHQPVFPVVVFAFQNQNVSPLRTRVVCRCRSRVFLRRQPYLTTCASCLARRERWRDDAALHGLVGILLSP